jgi:hypothetical protein
MAAVTLAVTTDGAILVGGPNHGVFSCDLNWFVDANIAAFVGSIEGL